MAIRQKKTGQDGRGQSAADQAYSGIVDLVLCHELRPGERTSVNLLAARLKLGRTPVKEAITRLQTQGLLSVAGRSGTSVNRIDRRQAEHLFALRQVLEGFAAEKAAKNVTAGQLRQLRVLLEEMRLCSVEQVNIRDAAGFVRANVAFHSLIVAAAGNPFLVRLYAQLQMQFQIVTYLLQRGYDPEAAEQRQREHEAIARALAARDGKMLKVVLRSHAQTTEKAILASLGAADLPRSR
jgi:DNA-binding GntR family transcriptional regulator